MLEKTRPRTGILVLARMSFIPPESAVSQSLTEVNKGFTHVESTAKV